MLKSVRVQNFQSLKDVLLRLVPNGVNVIIGSTDSGKSSLFRALMLLFENKLQGMAYRSWFARPREDTVVTVTTDLDDTIARVKSASKNQYIINGTEEFNAVGRGVPEEVKELLPFNISNFQPQHKPYFMLQSSPGDIGSAFADIVGLEIMDDVISKIETRVRRTREAIENERNEVAYLEARLDKYAPLAHLQSVLESTNEIEAKLIDTRYKTSDISTKLRAYEASQVEIERLDDYINLIEPLLKEAVKALNKVADAETPRYLKQAIAIYEMTHQHLEALTHTIDVFEPLLADINTILLDLDNLHTKQHDLDHKIRTYMSAAANADNLNTSIEIASIEIDTMMLELGRCPFCGSTVGRNNETTDIGGLAHPCNKPKKTRRPILRSAV